MATTTRLRGLITAVLLGATLTALTPQVAHAGEPGGGISVGVGGGGGKTPSPPPSDPGGPSGGGGGSTPGPGDPGPPLNYLTITGVTYWSAGQKQALPTPAGAGRFSGCATSSKWGKAIGATWSYQYVAEHGTPVAASLNYSCLYLEYNDERRTCATTIGPATISGPYDVSGTKAKAIASVAAKQTAFAKTHNFNSCITSWNVGVKASITVWGHWKGTATGKQQMCTLRTYTTKDASGRIPAPQMIGCSTPRTVSATVKGTLSCSGWENGWTNRSFTNLNGAGCQGSNAAATWNCTMARPTLTDDTGRRLPAYGTPVNLGGGKYGPTQVFKDGKNRTLRWGAVRFSGDIRNVTNKQTSLNVDSNSSPYRKGASQSAADQFFVTNPRAGDSTAGDRTAWSVNWQKGGMPGKPWIATKSMAFQAQVKTVKVVMTGINPATGQWITSKQAVWTTHTGTCTGPAAQVEVYTTRLANK